MAATVDREKAKKGIKARQDAVRTLIERHKPEFDELHMRNRVAAGLTPKPLGPSREQLEERIRKNREKLTKDEEMLRLVTS